MSDDNAASNKFKNTRLNYHLCSIGILICIIGILFNIDVLIKRTIDYISLSEEQKIADKIIQSQYNSLNLITDTKINNDIVILFELLEVGGKIEIDDYNFLISKDNEINAYATLGNYIIINTGLIQFVETPEELLAISAHEIAHVKNRHVLKNLITNIGLVASLKLITGDINGLALIFMQKTNNLLFYQFSRQNEKQADLDGISYLVSANISPIGFQDFFVRLQQKIEYKEKFEFLSTHPHLHTREDYIADLINQFSENNFSKINFDLASFQKKLAKF